MKVHATCVQHSLKEYERYEES